MIFRKDRKLDFRPVALVTVLGGAAILALGLVELGYNLWGGGDYYAPLSKVIGGWIVLSLGYIHLELSSRK